MTNTIARVLPFSIYMFFIAVQELLPVLGIELSQKQLSILYPLQIGLVTISLIFFKKFYTEINWKELLKLHHTILSIILGSLIILMWINLDTHPFITGSLTPFAHNVYQDNNLNLLLILIRFAGAVLIVPLMEELFWRSFLSRYLLNSNFMSIDHGKFTPFTFIATSFLFGIEHQLWLAGIIAGLIYNYIYHKTGDLSQCILSHAVSNMLLALYVVYGGNWKYW